MTHSQNLQYASLSCIEYSLQQYYIVIRAGVKAEGAALLLATSNRRRRQLRP